ncbi:unnamed protein product [Parascedosporium putredinis]|uniref:Uncharacterized protein n=1 Tax=Parascedosporium putredinis TaxID=1442378 RepID=A0A9P1M9T1_9PEZI|nr:unnamed protein product [Parascedosporium putredinis]CAI7992626.1 unnamed protein product [Parascedosporium putredinis]
MADLRLDGDDDPMVLSDHALAALAEFHSEQDAQVREFERVNSIAEAERSRNAPFDIELFTENWGRSQFWVADFPFSVLLDGIVSNEISVYKRDGGVAGW